MENNEEKNKYLSCQSFENDTVVRKVCITTYMIIILVQNIVKFVQIHLQETQNIDKIMEKFTETSIMVIPVPIVVRYSQEGSCQRKPVKKEELTANIVIYYSV